MSKYIDAELYVEMQIYDDEHEEWGEWQGTIEDLLNQWTEEGCPTPIEVSEDCISRLRDYQIEWLTSHCDIELEPKLEQLIIRFLNDTTEMFSKENAPSVVPSRAEGKWKSEPDCGITRCIKCGWSIEECIDWNYCPNCGAKMKGANDEKC